MQKEIEGARAAVECAFECKGTGYYAAVDSVGDDTVEVECPLHHPAYAEGSLVGKISRAAQEIIRLTKSDPFDMLGPAR